MSFFALIAALDGLALFLFGMHEMSAGLERVSGGLFRMGFREVYQQYT